MEHLGGRDPVDVLSFPVSFNQPFIPGNVCQHTQLDLGVVGIHKDKSIFRDKDFADHSAKFHTDRDVLKVRLCAADASRCRDRLMELAVNPSVCRNVTCQSVRVGGFELCKLTVLQNMGHDRCLRCQFLQHVGRSRVAGLRFLSIWKLQFFKQNHTELLRRIDIEGLASQIVDRRFQFFDPSGQLLPILL